MWKNIFKYFSSQFHNYDFQLINTSLPFNAEVPEPLQLCATNDQLNLILKDDDDFKRTRCVLSAMIDSICCSVTWEKALTPENGLFFREMFDYLRNHDKLLQIRYEKSIFSNYDDEKLKSVQNGLLQAIHEVCKDTITKEILNSDYLTVIIKDVSSVDEEPYFCVMLRYTWKGISSERFWSIVKLQNHDLAEYILSMLVSFKVYEVPRKLVAQAYDGSPQLSGVVQELVKAAYPNAHYIHSHAFDLESVMIKAVSDDKEIRNFFLNVESICKFFLICPQAITTFRIQERYSSIQFPAEELSLSKSVRFIHENRSDIINCMNTVLKEESINNEEVLFQATRIISIFESCSFGFWLSFFHDVLPSIEILSECHNLPDVKESLWRFKDKISKISNRLSADTEEESELEITPAKKFKTRNEIRKKQAMEACSLLISESELRFAFSILLIAEQLFNCELYEEYKIEFPEDIFNRVCNYYDVYQVDRFRRELETVYNTRKFRDFKIQKLYEHIKKNEKDSPLHLTMKLLEILLTFPTNPPGTAVMDRVMFSNLDQRRDSDEQETLSMARIGRDFIIENSEFQSEVIDKFADLPNWKDQFSKYRRFKS